MKLNPSWHCDKCNFNLCEKCSSICNAYPIELKDKCILNHSLKQATHKGDAKCRDCSNDIYDQRYCCNICNYHICENCYQYHNLEISQYPILSCFKGHLLRWNSQRNFNCNACAKNI